MGTANEGQAATLQKLQKLLPLKGQHGEYGYKNKTCVRMEDTGNHLAIYYEDEEEPMTLAWQWDEDKPFASIYCTKNSFGISAQHCWSFSGVFPN